MSEWRRRAWEIITEVDRALPPAATVAERREALRAEAWHAHRGTSWGKKVWGRAVKDYLSRHGVRRARTFRPVAGQPDLFMGEGAV